MAVDGRAARKGHVLRAGETVTWTPPPDEPAALVAEDVPLRVVYEDDWLLVVDKPAGVVVHPAPGHEHGTLVHGLVARGIRGGHGRRPGIVHRLDKETSGLLIVARRDDAYRRLVATMARREVSACTWRSSSARCPRTKAPSTRPSAVTSATASACRCTRRTAGRRSRTSASSRGPRAHACRGPPRDRPHAPDPRAHGGARLPGRRRRDLRAGARARRGSRVTSCTPRGSPSRTPRTAVQLTFSAPLPHELVAFLAAVGLPPAGAPPPGGRSGRLRPLTVSCETERGWTTLPYREPVPVAFFYAWTQK